MVAELFSYAVMNKCKTLGKLWCDLIQFRHQPLMSINIII